MENKIIKVTPELVTKFVLGTSSLDEWVIVVTAMEKYPEIKKMVDSLLRINRQFPVHRIIANPASMSVSKLFALRSKHLPVMRMAASSQANDCVLKCEQYVLEKRGLKSQYKELYKQAKSHDWLHNDGTPLYNIGRVLEMARLSIARRFKGNLDIIQQELASGCSIIVALNSERLHTGKNLKVGKAAPANHAVVVLDVNTVDDYVEIYDPQSNAPSDRYAVDIFLHAWRPSKNYFVSIIECGVRPYTPHPEYVAHIKLPDEITSIAVILAENAHEIWANDRQGEAKKKQAKGEKNKHEDDPFMKPFNELPVSKQKTDYLTALNTIKLLYKLGFTIQKDEASYVEHQPNSRTEDGQYIPRPIPIDDVVLTDDIAQLTEYIAENSHEEWAKQRIKEGWVFAPVTNKTLKQSFDLIPYCELLDSEKEYDRKMAMNTLRVLIKMGYRIEKA